jgi:ribose transport system permease protein
MSILRQGLMSMNLQSQWQTFFTGIVVILAVVLDNYRIRKASEVRKGLDEKRDITK